MRRIARFCIYLMMILVTHSFLDEYEYYVNKEFVDGMKES